MNVIKFSEFFAGLNLTLWMSYFKVLMYAYQRVFEAPQLYCDYLIEMVFDSGLIDYKFVSSLQ